MSNNKQDAPTSGQTVEFRWTERDLPPCVNIPPYEARDVFRILTNSVIPIGIEDHPADKEEGDLILHSCVCLRCCLLMEQLTRFASTKISAGEISRYDQIVAVPPSVE